MKNKSIVASKQILKIISKINKYKEQNIVQKNTIEITDECAIELTMEFLNLLDINTGIKLNILPYLYGFLFESVNSKIFVLNDKITDGSNYFSLVNLNNLDDIDEDNPFFGIRCKLSYQGANFTFYDNQMCNSVKFSLSNLCIEKDQRTIVMSFDNNGYECYRLIEENIYFSNPIIKSNKKVLSDSIESICELKRDSEDRLKVYQYYKSKINRNGQEEIEEYNKCYEISKYPELLYGNNFVQSSSSYTYNDKYEFFRNYLLGDPAMIQKNI